LEGAGSGKAYLELLLKLVDEKEDERHPKVDSQPSSQ
jgi:hypothetical protein